MPRRRMIKPRKLVTMQWKLKRKSRASKMLLLKHRLNSWLQRKPSTLQRNLLRAPLLTSLLLIRPLLQQRLQLRLPPLPVRRQEVTSLLVMLSLQEMLSPLDHLLEASPLDLLLETSLLALPLAKPNLLVLLLAKANPLDLLLVVKSPLDLLLETSLLALLLAMPNPLVLLLVTSLLETSPLVLLPKANLHLLEAPLPEPQALSELPYNNKIILLVSEDRRQGSLCFIR